MICVLGGDSRGKSMSLETPQERSDEEAQAIIAVNLRNRCTFLKKMVKIHTIFFERSSFYVYQPSF
ncbi:hypothetical protein CSV69_14265 [Sporosarcina sp. P26b]|nr:hypothetical protein CSV69_14265 [Sporosarcina sp. P26b]